MIGAVISMVKCATDTKTRDVGIQDVLSAIRSGGKTLKGQITQIRNRFEAELAITGERKKARLAVDPLKKELPAVLPSGRFSERANDALVKHSGLLCVDLDSLGDKLPEVRKKLEASPHVGAVFLSPTGDGLKVLFRVPADASAHGASFRAAQKHVHESTGCEIDESCKDPARLCFMSYDTELYVNENAVEITPLPEPEKPKPVQPGVELPGDLPLREAIATRELGPLKYSAEKGGYFCKCPGEATHTNSTGEKHTIVYLERVPTLDCQHGSCKRIVDAFNAKLRSEIGKAERQARREPPRIDMQSQDAPEPPPPPAPPYVPPPLDLLPSVLQDYVHAAAGSLNVDVSYPFLPLLSSLGAAIGNSRSIILKRGFIQPPVIWTGVIGPTGSLKSPGLEAGYSPMLEHERELKRQNQQTQELFEEDHAGWKSENPKKRGPEPEKPVIVTCLMDDLTIEVLSERLAGNPRGVLVAKDEISHWFASFDQYKNTKGSDVSRWLSIHTAVLLAVDRVKDNRHHRIWNPRVCITGGIQPKILRRVLNEEFFERGLPARFLLAYSTWTQPRWSEATVPEKLQKAVVDLFEELWQFQPKRDEAGQVRPKLLPLDDAAKPIFVRFYNECGAVSVEADEPGAAAWCKLAGHAARLALVGQLARDPKAEIITGDTMRAACDLARWFGNEAARIYTQLAETREQKEQRELAEFIERCGRKVTVREVTQLFRPLKNNRDEAERQLNALARAGRGVWKEAKGARGPATREFRLLQVSTSTGFEISPSVEPKPVDVDNPNSQKDEGVSGSDSLEKTISADSDKETDVFHGSTVSTSTCLPISPSTAQEPLDVDSSKREKITDSDESEGQIVSGDLKL